MSFNNYYSFYYEFHYEIYETIKSNRKLTEKEEEYKRFTQSLLKYCISPFISSSNAKISFYSKEIGELYLKKNYGKVDKYIVKLLLKNKLLFIFIVCICGIQEDDNYSDGKKHSII